MQQVEEAVVQQKRSLIGLLQECRHKKDGAAATRLHSYICHRRLESDPTLCNYLIPMLADCGSLPDVQRVLDRIPPALLNEHSWTSIITCFNDQGNPLHALHLFHQMQEESFVQPSKFTYVAAIMACSRLKDVQCGCALHAETTKRGLEKEAFIGSSLVDMYTKCGSLQEAYLTFNVLPCRNAVSWTALMCGYADCGLGQEALNCFEQMVQEGLHVDASTFVCALKACGTIGSLETGQGIYADVTKRGLDVELYVGSTIVDMYVKCGSFAEASLVFDQLQVRNVVSWNAMIAGYVENGMTDKVPTCFMQMDLEGIPPDCVTFLLGQKACGLSGASESGFEVHAKITERGWEIEAGMADTLIDMYAKCGLLEEAHQVLDLMPKQDAASWNALTVGYAERGLHEEVLHCFHQMQLKSIHTDDTTLACSLKACSTFGALETGQKIHMEMSKRGWDAELYVGNLLVNMYGKCSLIAEAELMSDRLHVGDAVSWNRHTAGYCENLLDLEVLTEMQCEGVSTQGSTLVYALKACGMLRAVETGQEIHTDLTKRGMETGLYTGSTLVDMYGKCGLLAESYQVFDMLPLRNAVSWNALIAGCADLGRGEDVLNYLKKMALEGVTADAVTFICSLKTGTLGTGQEIHIEAIKRGLDIDLLVGSSLVDMYCRCGLLAEARRVFDWLPLRNTVSWNGLITGYTEHGLNEQVLNCINDMQLEGVPVDEVTFVCGLKACGSIRASETGQRLHAEVIRKGFERDLHVGSTLVDMYGKCNLLEEAHRVFDMLPFRNEVSWNALIGGFVEHGFDGEALNHFKGMRQDGVEIDDVTFIWITKACRAVKDLETGREIHADITKKGLEREHNVGNTLVDMYSHCSSLSEASSVFEGLCDQNPVSWNTLIAGYVEHGLGEEVVNRFKQMQAKDVLRDAVTFILCLKGCGAIGALETGCEIHDEIKKAGLGGELCVCHALMNMYGKCGSTVEAREVFDQLPAQDTVSWNTIIQVYGENHDGSMAVQYFEKMQEAGVKPDAVTFTCVLAACSHASLIVEGEKYFELMRKQYRIEPTSDHYGCMVDLFARSGQVHQAERFIAAMQCSPSLSVLMALLSSCKSYGKLESGQRCFQLLVEMHQEDASAYLLMGDIYMDAGRLSDALKVEELRRYSGVKKKPGSAMLEMNKQLHQFVVGNYFDENIYEVQKLMSSSVKIEGYVPKLHLLSECTYDDAP